MTATPRSRRLRTLAAALVTTAALSLTACQTGTADATGVVDSTQPCGPGHGVRREAVPRHRDRLGHRRSLQRLRRLQGLR